MSVDPSHDPGVKSRLQRLSCVSLAEDFDSLSSVTDRCLSLKKFIRHLPIIHLSLKQFACQFHSSWEISFSILLPSSKVSLLLVYLKSFLCYSWLESFSLELPLWVIDPTEGIFLSDDTYDKIERINFGWFWRMNSNYDDDWPPIADQPLLVEDGAVRT